MKRFIERINYTENQTIELFIKDSMSINYVDYDAFKEHKDNLLFCMLDRNSTNCLIYDYRGAIQLSSYLNKEFTLIEYYQLLLNIAQTLNKLQASPINKQALVLELEHIYINPKTKEILLISLPIDGIYCDFGKNYRRLFNEVINHTSCPTTISEKFFNIKVMINSNFKLEEFILFLEQNSKIKPKVMNRTFAVMGICNMFIMIGGSLGYIYHLNKELKLMAIVALVSLFIICICFSYGILYVISMNQIKRLMNTDHLIIQFSQQDNKEEASQEVFVQEQSISSVKSMKSDMNNKQKNTSTPLSASSTIKTGLLNKEGDYELEEKKFMSQIESQPTGLLLDNQKTTAFLLNKFDKKQRFELKQAQIIVGREKEKVDICLDESSVSKIHAVINERNGVYYLSDQNSSNGTFVNNRRLEKMEDYRLNSSDEIKFANQEYIFNH